MPNPDHVRAAMFDEALTLAEEVFKHTNCDCDLDYRCIHHRAEDWLHGYDHLIELMMYEQSKQLDNRCQDCGQSISLDLRQCGHCFALSEGLLD